MMQGYTGNRDSRIIRCNVVLVHIYTHLILQVYYFCESGIENPLNSSIDSGKCPVYWLFICRWLHGLGPLSPIPKVC